MMTLAVAITINGMFILPDLKIWWFGIKKA